MTKRDTKRLEKDLKEFIANVYSNGDSFARYLLERDINGYRDHLDTITEGWRESELTETKRILDDAKQQIKDIKEKELKENEPKL